MELECRDGPKDDSKLRMLSDLLLFSNMSTIQNEVKRMFFEWYNLQRNLSGKKSQRTAMFIDHFLSYLYN